MSQPLAHIPVARLSFALAALALGLVLSACGGGGGGDGNEDQPVQTEFTVISTPTLDGVVFGDNAAVQSRADLQPGVGDGQFIVDESAGAVRFVSYFSFDLSDLPPGATIRSATLSLFNRAIQDDPQSMAILVRIDHVDFGAVFPTAILGATALDSNFAVIADINTLGRKNFGVGLQVQTDLDAGRTRSQYRLRGAIASDFDNVADLALLTDGEDSFGTGELPTLIIELEQP